MDNQGVALIATCLASTAAALATVSLGVIVFVRRKTEEAVASSPAVDHRVAADLAGIRAGLNDLRSTLASPAADEWRHVKALLSLNPKTSPAIVEASRGEIMRLYKATGYLPQSDVDILGTAFTAPQEGMEQRAAND